MYLEMLGVEIGRRKHGFWAGLYENSKLPLLFHAGHAVRLRRLRLAFFFVLLATVVAFGTACGLSKMSLPHVLLLHYLPVSTLILFALYAFDLI